MGISDGFTTMIRLGLVSAILGEIDWSAFFAALAETGSNVSVAIEVEDRACEGSLDNRILGVRQARRYLSQFCGI